MKQSFKAQSAMEYLMTYGWAILIIAVVLGALFSLGIFSGSAAIGSLCVPIPGYSCTAPALATTGNLSFTFGQNTGAALYNVAMACSSAATANGLPVPSYSGDPGCLDEIDCCPTTTSCSMVWMSVTGTAMTATAYNAVNSLFFTPPSSITSTDTAPNGQQFSVSGLQCWGPLGQLGSPTPAAIGTMFSGALWVNYTLEASAPSSTNPVYSVKFATLNTKVV